MTQQKLQGSGGYIMADITDEQAKVADLGVGKLFLAPIGKLWRLVCQHCHILHQVFFLPSLLSLANLFCIL